MTDIKAISNKKNTSRSSPVLKAGEKVNAKVNWTLNGKDIFPLNGVLVEVVEVTGTGEQVIEKGFSVNGEFNFTCKKDINKYYISAVSVYSEDGKTPKIKMKDVV